MSRSAELIFPSKKIDHPPLQKSMLAADGNSGGGKSVAGSRINLATSVGAMGDASTAAGGGLSEVM